MERFAPRKQPRTAPAGPVTKMPKSGPCGDSDKSAGPTKPTIKPIAAKPAPQKNGAQQTVAATCARSIQDDCRHSEHDNEHGESRTDVNEQCHQRENRPNEKEISHGRVSWQTR